MKCHFLPLDSFRNYYSNGYKVIVADTQCQKSQGLKFQKLLSNKIVMLFLNISPGNYFTTTDCKFPIDIYCLSTTNQILHVWNAPVGLNKIGPMPPGTSKVLESVAGALNYSIGDSVLIL